MPDEGLRFEAFSMPHVGALTKKFDFSKWVESYTLNDRFNDLTDGVLTLPDDFPLAAQLFHVDEANHANDVGSMIRVLRGTTPILHYLVTRSEDSWSDQEPTHKLALEGLEWILDRALVPNYDHPADPTVDPDWIYGADTVLKNAGLEESGESKEVQLVWLTGATGGTFTITFSAQTTTAIAWNADWFAVGTALEALSNIQDVTVSGAGTGTSPWTIEFLDPDGDVAAVTLNIGSLTGPAPLGHVETTLPGGQSDTAGWTTSFNPSTGEPHGTYDNFQVTTAQAHSGTHSLLINASAPANPFDFPGAQQILNVTPGRTYRAEVWIRPTFSSTFKLVIRTMDETWIAESTGSGTPLTANVWTKLTVDPFVIPEWIDQIIFRVGLIDSTDRGDWYLDDAVLAPGFPAAPLGKMASDIFTAAQALGVLLWLTPTWTTTLDSDGNAWDQDRQWNVNHGQTFLQLFEYCRKWNYEFRIRWDAGDSRFEWDMWNPLAGGQARANIAVTGKSGVMGSAPIVQRPPNATYVKAEGELGRWGEFASTTLDDVWGRLERFHQDRQGVNSAELDVLAERIITKTTENTAARAVTVSDPTLLPWQAYEPGDTVTLNLAPKDVKRVLRVAAIVVSKGPNDAAPKYDVHFGAPVYSNDTAIASGLRTLIREFRRPTFTSPAAKPIPDIPPTDPTVTGGLEDASWVFAGSDSSAQARVRSDEICDGTADQTTIIDACIAVGSGTIGFHPGRYKFNDSLSNSDVAGNNVNLGFTGDLRFRGSPGVIFEFDANPATSLYLVRVGDATSAAQFNRLIFDGITFDGGGHANVEGALAGISTGNRPGILFINCTFNNFQGDHVLWGDREHHLHVDDCFFFNCDPDVSFFHLGGFSDGDVQIHDFSMIGCSGTLWTGAGFSQGGLIYEWNSDTVLTVPIDPLVPVFHYRNGTGLYTAGDHSGINGTGMVLNTLADAKGDIIAATANDTWARLAVGANKLALHAASAEATGLKWQLPGGRTSIAGFHRENLAASLTASQLERSLSGTLDAALPVVVTHAASIVGISVASTEARTASTATFEVYKNGAATGLTAVLDGTNTTFAFAVQAIDLDTVAAGDRLDVRVTTTGTWTPTTADVEATIVLQYDPA